MNSQDHTNPDRQPAKPPPPPAGIGGSTSGLGKAAWVIVGVVILAAIAGFLPRQQRERRLTEETKELAIKTVNVVSPAPGKASAALLLPAEVRPVVEAPIYARANGYVNKWYVDIGGVVKTGDLLADIDAPELDQQLTQAKAELEQAEAARALSKITAARWAELLKTSSVSEQENAEKQADLALKDANVDAAKANVHRLEDLQAFTHVHAPFSGILTVRDIDVGDLISSGKELFRLADTTKLRVFVRVPQSATGDVATGSDADLVIPEMPGRVFTARVVRTSGAIDANSRTLLTELEVPNQRGEILAGAYAQVSFHDLKKDPALVLPSNTLLFRAEGLQVGVVQANGLVELRSVVLGRDFGPTVEIVNGVKATDKIIVNPSDSLVSGAMVRISEPAPDKATNGLASDGKLELAK